VGERTYFVAQPVMQCDAVLNLPKLKTHNLTILTGAVKNMFGILPGFQKTDLHRKFPKPLGFSAALVDVFSLAPPRLTIMDAVIAMEGNGPSEGELRKVGIILASDDAVALDAVAGLMIGLAPHKVHTTRIATERGLGLSNPDLITLKGANWESLPIPGFKLPATHIVNRIPEGLSKLLAGLVWIQPRVDAEVCTKCGKCVESCPMSCISLNQSAAVIDKKKCIKCYCCTEVCPEGAVVLDRSLMARAVMR
jgi:NAD-dependent dihydropyrimidine dehydrogenase PreA subunit